MAIPTVTNKLPAIKVGLAALIEKRKLVLHVVNKILFKIKYLIIGISGRSERCAGLLLCAACALTGHAARHVSLRPLAKVSDERVLLNTCFYCIFQL
jgi:hypothetical protein